MPESHPRKSLPRWLAVLVPVLLALTGAAAMAAWLATSTRSDLDLRVPGLDRAEGTPDAAASAGPIEGRLIKGDGVPSELPGNWPWFRGLAHDNVAGDPVKLARKWPQGGPKRLWSVELGEGYSGPVVRDGRVWLLDYDAAASADALRCLSLADGKEIWRYSYPVAIKRQHGMSRTVPALTDRYVVSIGPKCHVVCLDATTGERQWFIDLVAQFGSKVPEWYAGQCPLIEGDRVILAPGGPDALLMAVDLKTGHPIWKTPNRRGWKMTHSSIVPMEFGGRRMYVYCGSGGVAGVAASDGALLWETTDWKISIATVPSPVPLPEGRIFLSGGYSAGAMFLQLKQDAGRYTVTSERLKANRFGATQHTPIFLGGYLYGLREKDKEMVCLDLTGKEVWRSGSQHRFGQEGCGPFLAGDGLLFVMDDEGTLSIAEASPAGYKQLDQAHVLDGHESWGPMALVAGRLLVRDLTVMRCLDVSQAKP
jgi:outer membrane protein assembly factor BamB